MIALITVSVILATGLLALAFYWWMESREGTLSERLKGIEPSPLGSAKPKRRTIKGYLSWVWENFNSRIRPKEDEIVSIITGGELTGARRLLQQAGYRSRLAYQIYFWIRLGLPIVLGLLPFIYVKKVGGTNKQLLLLLLLAVSFGYIFPSFALRRLIRKRQEAVTDALPDALDLMVVCVEAGLGLNAAFIKISEEFSLSSPQLSAEFEIVNREMVAGKPRQEALRALAERTGVEDMKSLVAMLIQTEKLGTSLAQSLRVHSDSLRTKRRQRAEDAAAKTTIKLMFPLVFFLFPAMFIVLLGPGVIQIMRILFPTMRGQ
ncbi:MAG TPA: type II secretion system F family protein [Nitrospiria bacterium]|nr:type II secretion system F family protein [Nitrospiria bacterium]